MRRVAIVTGASRRQGIGAAICRALAADGVDILFTHYQPYDRSTAWGADEEGPEALQRELAASGVRCVALHADLSLPETPEAVLDAVQAQLGQVSILVNNAAHSENGDFQQLDAAQLDAHYAVNVRGAILLSAGFARRWSGGEGGRIINISSGQSLGPMPGELAYVATKGAIEAFTRSLAAEVAGRGITVNVVDPGATDTGWMSDALKRDLLARSQRGRPGRPEDAARLVAFLASDAATWITGQLIRSRGEAS